MRTRPAKVSITGKSRALIPCHCPRNVILRIAHPFPLWSSLHPDGNIQTLHLHFALMQLSWRPPFRAIIPVEGWEYLGNACVQSEAILRSKLIFSALPSLSSSFPLFSKAGKPGKSCGLREEIPADLREMGGQTAFLDNCNSARVAFPGVLHITAMQ